MDKNIILETPSEMFNNFMQEKINKLKTIDIAQVVDVDEDKLFVSVKPLNHNIQYDNVQIMSIGIGNNKGIISLPNVNDIVLIAFLNKSTTPIMLGSLFDIYSPSKDYKLPIKKNEIFINGQDNGSYIYIKKDNSIHIKNKNGIGLTVLNDGKIKIGDYTFPATDGNAGQVLKTDGNGNLYWADDIDT